MKIRMLLAVRTIIAAVVLSGFCSGEEHRLVEHTPSQFITDPGARSRKTIRIRVCDGALQTSIDGTIWAKCLLPTKTFVRGVVSGQGRLVAVGGSYLDVRAALFTSCNGSSWTRRRIPTTSNLYDVTYGNGMFVTVGEAGAVLTSTNGTDWVSRRSGCDDALLAAVEFGNAKFVAGGELGTLISSTNGIEWARMSLGQSMYIGRIKFANNSFWARTGSRKWIEVSDSK